MTQDLLFETKYCLLGKISRSTVIEYSTEQDALEETVQKTDMFVFRHRHLPQPPG